MKYNSVAQPMAEKGESMSDKENIKSQEPCQSVEELCYVDILPFGANQYVRLRFPDGSGQLLYREYLDNNDKLQRVLEEWLLHWITKST